MTWKDFVTILARALVALLRALQQRLGPFLDLLDARYIPSLLVAFPQAYAVYAWLMTSGVPEWVAQMGGAGFEFVYVGSIAWATRGAGWQAARGPAVTALMFSVAVAVAHYGPTEGWLALLHAGFPLVGYFYVLMMHAQTAPRTEALPTIWALLRQRVYHALSGAHPAAALAAVEAPAPQPVQHITQAVQVIAPTPPQTVRGFIAMKAQEMRQIDGSMSYNAIAAALGTSADTVRRALTEEVQG